MTSTFISGAWYVDALPSGEYVALLPSVHLQTHLGVIAFPPGEAFGPLYVRCTAVGGFRFAGQAHDTLTPAAYEWTQGAGWRPLPPPCVGNSPVIYDRLGILHLSDGSIGSQGWRYVADDGTPEGQLVTGDATYGPFHGLSEWTQLAPNLWIGQGHDVLGALVWDGAVLRLLEAGNRRFIRAHVDGESVAVAMMAPDGAVILQTSLAELRALPLVQVAYAPPQYPDPKPAPLPAPSPEPPVSTPGSSAANPTITSSLDEAFLRGAIRASWEALNHRPQPASDNDYWYTLESQPAQFSDGVWRVGHNAYWEARMDPTNTGSADPHLGDQPARFQPDMPSPPTPPPQPQPSFDPGALLIRLAALEQRALTAEQRIAALEAKPDPVVPGVDLHAYAKKGDPVTVGGKVNVFGVNRWTGSIDK